MMVLQLESNPNNRYHTIATSVLDKRSNFERGRLQRHNINGRKLMFRQIPDEINDEEVS